MHVNWGTVLTAKNYTSNQIKTAIIDVGSNSVRFAVYPTDKLANKVVKTTRLAKGFVDGILTDERIERTALAVSDFCSYAKNIGVSQIFVFATAAVRNAKNKSIFIDRVKSLCGLEVEVVSGDDEAMLGALGSLEGDSGGVIDVGGASTEIIVCDGSNTVFSKSFNIGAVTLTEKFSDNIKEAKAYLKSLFSNLKPFLNKNFYTIGGTATTIASILLKLVKYDPFMVHGFEIKVCDLESLVIDLYSKSINERKNMVGLDPNRAEIIHSGVLILTELLKILNIDSLYVSEKDNMEGYYMLKGKIDG